MTTIEGTLNETKVITSDEAKPMAGTSHYDAVRFNAMKHGTLSRLVVSGHDDHAELDDILAPAIQQRKARFVASYGMRGLLLTYIEQERVALEHKVDVLVPKAEALGRIADAEGLMNPTAPEVLREGWGIFPARTRTGGAGPVESGTTKAKAEDFD